MEENDIKMVEKAKKEAGLIAEKMDYITYFIDRLSDNCDADSEQKKDRDAFYEEEIYGALSSVQRHFSELSNSLRKLYITCRKPLQGEQYDKKHGFIFEKQGEKVVEKITNSYLESTKNGFHLKLPLAPAMLNKNLSHHKTICNFWRDLVTELCENYIEFNEYISQKLNKYTVIFVHHYTEEMPMRDTDNIVIKNIIDGLGWRILTDDSMKSAHICVFTKEDSEPFTEVFVIPGHHYFDNFKKNISG